MGHPVTLSNLPRKFWIFVQFLGYKGSPKIQDNNEVEEGKMANKDKKRDSIVGIDQWGKKKRVVKQPR